MLCLFIMPAIAMVIHAVIVASFETVIIFYLIHIYNQKIISVC